VSENLYGREHATSKRVVSLLAKVQNGENGGREGWGNKC
jgi:hypothetical protein